MNTETTQPGNVPEYSVSEISQVLKRTVESAFDRVRVRGEISRPTRAGSGHLYFTLKDESAVMDAVCWRGNAQRLSVNPEEGMEVICIGKLTTYPGRSKYQIVIEQMELAGEGALLKLLEERRKKLAGEGLFDAERKRQLPFLPQVIGVVTSPTGAVIRDILHRLGDRFPVHVLVAPVLVQGETAKDQVAAAIRGFNALPVGGNVPRPNLLIVARGGGSLEDLWAFNEEVVVRAAAESDIPLISAVGHETDTTLIDFASDRRAPTPTAAAEIAVPVRAELLAQIMDNDQRLWNAIQRRLSETTTHINGLARGLGDPSARIEALVQRLDDLTGGISANMNGLLDRKSLGLSQLWSRIKSPTEKLSEQAAQFEALSRQMDHLKVRMIKDRARDLKNVGDRLRPEPVMRRHDQAAKDLNQLGERLTKRGTQTLADAETRLETLSRVLESNSFERILDKGFALIRDDAGQPILTAAATNAGQSVSVQFSDGTRGAVIDGDGPAKKPAPKKKPRPKAEDSQETLF